MFRNNLSSFMLPVVLVMGLVAVATFDSPNPIASIVRVLGFWALLIGFLELFRRVFPRQAEQVFRYLWEPFRSESDHEDDVDREEKV